MVTLLWILVLSNDRRQTLDPGIGVFPCCKHIAPTSYLLASSIWRCSFVPINHPRRLVAGFFFQGLLRIIEAVSCGIGPPAWFLWAICCAQQARHGLLYFPVRGLVRLRVPAPHPCRCLGTPEGLDELVLAVAVIGRICDREGRVFV